MTSDEHNSYSYALTADPGKPLREAKASIATLTGDNEMLNGIIKGLRQMLADVEPAKEAAERELHQHHELLKLVVDGATRLRHERDDARREICRMVFASGGIPPAEYAKTIGWDCFSQEDSK